MAQGTLYVNDVAQGEEDFILPAMLQAQSLAQTSFIAATVDLVECTGTFVRPIIRGGRARGLAPFAPFLRP